MQNVDRGGQCWSGENVCSRTNLIKLCFRYDKKLLSALCGGAEAAAFRLVERTTLADYQTTNTYTLVLSRSRPYWMLQFRSAYAYCIFAKFLHEIYRPAVKKNCRSERYIKLCNNLMLHTADIDAETSCS